MKSLIQEEYVINHVGFPDRIPPSRRKPTTPEAATVSRRSFPRLDWATSAGTIRPVSSSAKVRPSASSPPTTPKPCRSQPALVSNVFDPAVGSQHQQETKTTGFADQLKSADVTSESLTDFSEIIRKFGAFNAVIAPAKDSGVTFRRPRRHKIQKRPQILTRVSDSPVRNLYSQRLAFQMSGKLVQHPELAAFAF